MGLRTEREARRYYNKWSEYESSSESAGYVTPMQFVESLAPYLGVRQKILDVGCGTGLVGNELKRLGWRGTLIGVDIAENRLLEAVEKRIYAAGIQASAYLLPWKNNSFDAVISNEMVGLTGVRSVCEMYRVLKPGGYLACVVVEFKNAKWSRARFRKICAYFRRLPKAKLLLRRNLGTGYLNTNYNDERRVLFLLRKKLISKIKKSAE